MEPKAVMRRVLAVVLAVIGTGCTHLFAREAPPDVEKIVVGAPRAVVEAELGSPISDIANVQRATGLRECIYKVLVKETVADDATTAEAISAGMVGFSTFQYRVLYDRSGNVVHADELKL